MRIRMFPLSSLNTLAAATVVAAVTTLAGCGGDEEPPVDDWDVELQQEFVRMDAMAPSGSGHTVFDECSTTGETWPDAAATISVQQNAERTLVEIGLTGGRPDTLYTFWLRLAGTDPLTGEAYGGSPITGGGSTPLAPSTDLALLEEVGAGPGSPTAVNGFTSDATGSGSFAIELDFPMIDGAYPFDRYDPALPAVDTVGAPDAPFLIRMASHCTDGLSHGLSAGTREAWFNWSP